MRQEDDQERDGKILNLGSWLGRQQAFRIIGNRCTAAGAESLKAIRDSGEYKELRLTWEQFCVKHAGMSRVHADRQIHYLEEFGPNYFRIAEVIDLSPATYRLIAASISDKGIEANGEVIPIARENREQLAAVVNVARSQANPAKERTIQGRIGLLRMRLEGLLDDLHHVATAGKHVQEIMELIEEGGKGLRELAAVLEPKNG